MLTGELFGAHYGNLYQLDPTTGTYTMLGALHDGGTSYDPTCLFMTYGDYPVVFTVGNLNYLVNDDGVSVTVLGHVDGSEATGELNIPESVSYESQEYAVTVIGNEAFANCSGLTGTLTIGEAVTYIGDWAFRGCTHISEAITLATTPATLGDDFGCQVFAEFGVRTITVPCECGAAYLDSPWYDPTGTVGFNEIVEDCEAISESESIVTTVYPNPTKGIVKIEAKSIRNISIFNILGETIFETPASGDIFEYDFSNHEAGVYFIKVKTATGVGAKQVTVL